LIIIILVLKSCVTRSRNLCSSTLYIKTLKYTYTYKGHRKFRSCSKKIVILLLEYNESSSSAGIAPDTLISEDLTQHPEVKSV